MFIDCHTHAFADKIAEKAVAQLINYYQLPTSHGGTLPHLLHEAQAAGLDALILLVAATRPEQVKPAHDWLLSLPDALVSGHPQIIRFGTFHLDDADWLAEVQRLRAAGFKGVKLHPEFQNIDLADRRLEPFLEEIAGEMILMVHVGDPRVSATNLSTPRKVAALLEKFPRLTVIAAHLGGYCFWQEAFEHLAGRDIFLDTSSALPFIDPALLQRLIDRHGSERILFGSDFPLSSPARELEAFNRALPSLTTAQREAILGGNCAMLLGLA